MYVPGISLSIYLLTLVPQSDDGSPICTPKVKQFLRGKVDTNGYRLLLVRRNIAPPNTKKNKN